MLDRDRAERELDRELRGYIDLLIEEKIRAGKSPADARRDALIETGGVEQVKERVRDVRLGASFETLLQDLRYALRTLRAAPAFTCAAVLTLAIGIGANTAIFSAVDGVLLKPLPFSQPDRIVSLFQNDRKQGVERGDVAPGNFADWRARARGFSAMAAAEPFSLTYTGPDGQELVGNWNVTEDFFAVLDARPVLGRLLHRDDFIAGQPAVVLLTYDSWQRRFNADPAVVGASFTLGGVPRVIVGILPRNFSYLGNKKRYELFTPKVLDTMELNLRGEGWYHIVGRLQPGVTRSQAAADLNRVAAQLEREYPKTNTAIYTTVVPLRDGMVGDTARGLLLLLGAVGFVLLIACANVANLSLARTARRSREFAVRVALGAGPRRIARQVLTESFLIAVAGGVAGTALAYWALRSIRALSPANLPRIDEMRVDIRALTFAMCAVVVTTFLFGLLPAIRAGNPGSAQELKAGARAVGSGVQRRLRGLLMSAEVALAVVLLVGAGLLMRSFMFVTSTDRGYRSDHVLSGIAFIWQWNPTPALRHDFVTRLTERLSSIPGVEAAGVTSSLPLDAPIGADEARFSIVGQSITPGEEPTAHVTALTPGAFSVLRMHLDRGRTFTARDDTASVPVAMVSASLARRFFPNGNPLGERITVGFYGRPVAREIVGVVADIRQSALDAPPDPTVYLPHSQAATGSISILVRTTGAPLQFTRQLKAAVAELNPQIPVTAITTLDDVVSGSLKARRFTLLLFGCFAGAALLLAVIGVYGVISHGTSERAKEFGVRMALGAQRSDVILMVVRQGVVASGIGLIFGIVGASALTTVLRGMLFGVTRFDAVTFIAVSALMLATALVACYIPARRATTVHPVQALRAS